MSSLAAARADNFYYPKEWRPEHGSINKCQKSHPLGKRAKDISKGILVVRFEMPYNVYCTSCEGHIGKGVRFNAKKKKFGNYFSTVIWEFELSCPACKEVMIVQTDPEHCDYKLVHGIRKKQEEFTAEQAETEYLNDKEISSDILNDPFYKLEHAEKDKQKASRKKGDLEALIDLRESDCKDSYTINQQLRRKFRQEKKLINKKKEAAEKRGIYIPLVDVQQEDIDACRNIVFKKSSAFREIEKRQRFKLKSSSIFGQQSSERDRKLAAFTTARKRKINGLDFRLSIQQTKQSSINLSVKKQCISLETLKDSK